MDTSDIREIDDNKRRQLILNFISNNQGCNKQYVVDYFDANEGKSKRNIKRSNTNISKKTIYRIIRELVNDGLLREERERSNSRDLMLYVDTDNLLVTIPNELDQFKTNFITLLDVVKKRIEGKSEEEMDILRDTLFIFSELFNICNYHALLIWPRQIQNKDYLNKLYLLAFSRIMNIYLEILDRFGSLIPDKESLRDGIDNLIPSNYANIFVADKEDKPDSLSALNLSRYGLSKQTEPLLKYLAKINSQIKPTHERNYEFIRRLRR